MSGTAILSDTQRKLAADHTNVIRWAIYNHIKCNENIVGMGYDDLFQEGCLCLCKAAASYDGDRAKFITYAQVVVKNGLLTYCAKVCRRYVPAVSLSDIPYDTEDGSAFAVPAADDIYDDMLSAAAVFGLLESVKAEYSGIVLLGIEALELKTKGYTGADIANLWGVRQNLLGAWISKAKKKLIQDERFIAALRSF